MNHLLNRLLIGLALCCFGLNAHSADSENLPDIKAGIVSIKVIEPLRNVGYTVGDVLTRNVQLTIKKPYVLIDESLPIIGYERRYKGQLIGIDLSAITHTKKTLNDKIQHDINLSYQVFTNNVVAKHASLPQEYVRLINTESKGKEVVKYRIPSWDFAISPLSIFGGVKVEGDMTSFRGPLLLDSKPVQTRLYAAMIIFGLSLISLVYILGKYNWLPRMGGPFAKSYRTIRSQSNTQLGLQKAVSSVHLAFNATAGNSVFGGNLHLFLEKKPAFTAIKAELEQFFALSRQIFFEPNSMQLNSVHTDEKETLQWLAQFSRRCRDCERGLIPDSLTADKQAVNNPFLNKVKA